MDVRTGVITTFAGTGESGRGAGGFGGDDGPATEARLNFPIDVALDAAGNLWIADLLNNRVRRVDTSTGVITTLVGGGRVGVRETFSGDNGPAAAARLELPRAIVFDANGNLFIATQAHRVRAVRAPIN